MSWHHHPGIAMAVLLPEEVDEPCDDRSCYPVCELCTQSCLISAYVERQELRRSALCYRHRESTVPLQ